MAYTGRSFFVRPVSRPLTALCRITVLPAVLLLVCAPGLAPAGEPEPDRSHEPNLAVMQSLIEAIGRELLPSLSVPVGETIALSCQSGEEGWIVQQSLAAALTRAGMKVYVGRDSVPAPNLVVEVRSVALGVGYTDLSRDQVMGTRRITRTVSAAFVCLATDARTGKVLFSGTPARQLADTVSADDVPALESPTVRSTHADLPSGSFLDRMVEPFVILGATGIAVYLLFHVRS